MLPPVSREEALKLMQQASLLYLKQAVSDGIAVAAKTYEYLATGLPVLAETIPDFELVTWHGVMVPAATPRDIVLRLNREIQAVLGEPDIRRRFADGGLDITGGTPEQFEAILKRDYAKYGKILTGAGIKPE